MDIYIFGLPVVTMADSRRPEEYFSPFFAGEKQQPKAWGLMHILACAGGLHRPLANGRNGAVMCRVAMGRARAGRGRGRGHGGGRGSSGGHSCRG